MSPPADRYHALDSLRGFAMLLGVVLHAAVSFMANPPAFWSVRDNDPTPLADVFLFAVHDFRMQLFFLLAGFFGGLLYRKYGAAGTARHRVKRVAVPLALGVLFVIPTVMAAFLYAEIVGARAEGVPENAPPARRFAADLVAENPGKGDLALVAVAFTSGAATKLPLAHLWFLYYLLLIYAPVLAAAPLAGRLSGTRLLATLDAAFRRAVEGRLRVAAPALLTVPVLLCMTTPVADTPLGWVPEWQILLYYFGFFAFGWALYRHRDLVPAFGRGWGANLAVANLLVFPVALGLTLGGMEAEKTGRGGVFAWKAGAFAVQALYTWLMIVGLWGAFLHVFARESAWARYLADASYWCYLASITPIVLLQFAVKDWPLPGLLKWGLVTAATAAVLLASYEWCVRYTVVGAILNGRKRRVLSADYAEERRLETEESKV